MEIMEKTKLFKSEFYKGMERTIHDWDDALGKDREDAAVMRKLSWCLAQWEVYRKAIKFIYGTKYHFSRTDEYFGLCDEDGKDWLLYVEREPATCQCIQTVREYGIKCNETEYYNEEFVELYLGEEVRVIETEKTVKVRDMQGNKIIHFPKLPVEKVKEMFKGFTTESIRVAAEATQPLVEETAFSKQRVTRRGIIIDGIEYWDADFIYLNLGRTVMVECTSCFVNVHSETGTLLHVFRK